MLLAALIATLFLTWLIYAPNLSIYGRCREKIVAGQTLKEVENTGVSIMLNFIAALFLFGLAKLIDWFFYPWGSYGVISFMLILVAISLPSLIRNCRFVRRWIAEQPASD